MTGLRAASLDLAEVGRIAGELFPEALGIWVYGSQADGTARPGSDIDVAVLPARPVGWRSLFDRQVALATRLGRDVDLVDLRSVSTVLRFEVVTRGLRVAVRDPFACDLFETATISMYQRLNESQRGQLQDLVRLAWRAA